MTTTSTIAEQVASYHRASAGQLPPEVAEAFATEQRTSRSATSRYLPRAWPRVASRLGKRSPSAWASSRPSAAATAASSGQVC